MALRENETKQKARYKIPKHKSPESRLGSQYDKDNKLPLSVVKIDAKSKIIESSNKSLEESIL